MIESLKKKQLDLQIEAANLATEAGQNDMNAQQFINQHNQRQGEISARLAEIRGAEAVLAELLPEEG